MGRRPSFQHGIKRGKVCEWTDGAGSPEDLADRVTYTGSPKHKSYPSPAGPPAWRNADAAKCDRYAREDWPRLREALRMAIRARCVGDFDGVFPRRAWVWINGVLHEARITNEAAGDYHGFPLNHLSRYPEPLERVETAPRVEIPVVYVRSHQSTRRSRSARASDLVSPADPGRDTVILSLLGQGSRRIPNLPRRGRIPNR